MPGTPTTKYAIPTLAGTDLARDIDTLVNSSLSSIDSKMVGYSAGTLAARPTSTGGSPGIAGRRYRATDTGQEFIDTGTGWTEVGNPLTLLGEYRTIAECFTLVTGVASGATYVPNMGALLNTGTGMGAGNGPFLVSIRNADFAVSGLTAKLRLHVAMGVNGIAPGVNFTWGLYPMTFGGGSASVAVVAGTVVSGSSVTRNTPAANTGYQDVSGDFSLPSDGLYFMGLTASGSMNASSAIAAAVRLQVHHT